MSERTLDRLQHYVEQAASRLKDLGDENALLRKRIDDLQEKLEELRRESLAKGRDIESLKQERVELRSRVKRIRKNLATLEAGESTL